MSSLRRRVEASSLWRSASLNTDNRSDEDEFLRLSLTLFEQSLQLLLISCHFDLEGLELFVIRLWCSEKRIQSNNPPKLLH